MLTTPQHYSISNAIIKQEQEPQLLVTQTPTTWVSYLIMGILFGMLSLFLFSLGESNILFGVFTLSFTAIFFAQPNKISLEIDTLTHTIRFFSLYWFGLRKIEKSFSFDQVAIISHRPPKLLAREIVDMVMVDGNQIVFTFAKSGAAAQFVNKISTMAASGTFPMLNSTPAIASASVFGSKSLMQRELRSWQVWLVITGVAQMFAAGGFSSWGALLIAVALLSFYFADASMFVIFAVTIAWAGLSNLFSGAGTWTMMAFFQFFLAFQIFQQFRRFRQAEQVGSETAPSRTARYFPWATLSLGLGALLGFVLVVLGIIVTVITRTEFGAILSWLETISVYAALLGLSTGIAGLASGYSQKWFFIAGTILATLTLLGELGFMLLSLF